MKYSELYSIMTKIPLFKGFDIEEIETLFQKIGFQIKKYKKKTLE